MVLVSAHSNLLFQIYQCALGGIFWLSGQDVLVGFSELWVFLGGYILFARDWNLHIIDSLVVGAIDWSFMELDAAWHEWFSVALAVVIDGVLAVSAQCGCCHHFLQYFTYMPFHVCYDLVSFFSSFGLNPVCYMYSSFVESILHILHGLLFVFFFFFFF